MADIDIRRPHGLGMAKAREAADRMAGELSRKFGLQGDWRGDVLHFQRPGVTGSLTVAEHEIHLVVALGFMLKAMRGSIESGVEREMETLFGPATRTAEAPPKRGA
jgi:putative polyhydroxyalkanoate system protein